MYCYIWEYIVRPEERSAFQAVYGPEGEWVRLFRRDPRYLRTVLLRDRTTASRFLTVDFWSSGEACAAFRERHRAEFDALDARCAALTQHESPRGDFDVVES